MDQVKNTISVQRYPVGKQSSFISIQEDGSTCLKHVVGYSSPKLTPKHTRSVKQSKRKTKNHETSPHLQFPPPPSYPPPEHYNLSDEYSADLIDADVPNCKTDYHLNDNLVCFRTAGDDQPPEDFWNSPVEAPWSYFSGSVPKKKEDTNKMNDWKKREKVTDLDDPNDFWEGSNGNEEEGWILKSVDSSTPYMERKGGKGKKKKKKGKEEEMDQVSEEIMLINKLKEDSSFEENGNGRDGFRNEIWVNSAAPAEEIYRKDNSTIQITKNHISNVLITHGNDEILDNFVENKPIHGEVKLINNHRENDKSAKEDKNGTVFVPKCDGNRKYQMRLNTTELGLMGDSPDEYSYAYYEPGPINKVISIHDRKKYEYDRNSRHTYTTRYGTEENIYEEITEVSCNFKNRYVDPKGHKRNHAPKEKSHHQYVPKTRKSQSQMSLNQSIVEEEVREVQSTHRRVLGQLNLTMEAMLMPNSVKEKDEVKQEFDGKIKEDVPDDNPLNQITDLDSGFSGSSGTSVSFYGGSNYVKSVAPFRRPDLPRNSIGKSSKYVNAQKTPVHSDMIDYRSAGYCPDSCCTSQAPYHVNGMRVLPGRCWLNL